MKILVVTTHADIDQRLQNMIEMGSIPEAEYSIVVELFQVEGDVGKNFPQTFAFDDLRNRSAIDSAIKQCFNWGPFDQVLATDEYSLFLAAEIRDRLHIKGHKSIDVLRFRDKVAMKKALNGSTIRAPQLFSAEDLMGNPENFPIVEKPRSFAGSKGVKVLKCVQDLLESIAAGRSGKEPDEFTEFCEADVQFEEWIQGDVFHVDGLVFDSKIIFCTASRYHGTCLEFLQGKVLGSSSECSSQLKSEWTQFATEVTSRLRIPDGAFHLEAFLSPSGEKVFLEIGARPGGAFIVPSIRQATGLDLDVAHLQCQMGIRPFIPSFTPHFGWLTFPRVFNGNPREKITRISCPELSEISGLKWHKILEVGAPTAGSFSYTESLASFVFTASEAGLIDESIRKLKEGFKVESSADFEKEDPQVGPLKL